MLTLTLKQLQHFVAVAATGQVSRAAERCGVSQPTLTSSLQNLESALGTKLFVRHADGLRPTQPAERFLRQVERVLGLLDEAVADLRGASEQVDGRVALAVSDTVSGYLLPSLLVALRARLPNVEVAIAECGERQIVEGLRQKRFELAVALIAGIDAADDLVSETLVRSPRRLWTSVDHPLASRERVSPAELGQADYVLLDVDEHAHAIERYCRQQAWQPRVTIRSKSIEAVRSMVARNLGVTILPDLVYRPWSHDGGRLRRLELDPAPPTMDLGVAHVGKAALSAAAQAIVGLLRSSSKQWLAEAQVRIGTDELHQRPPRESG